MLSTGFLLDEASPWCWAPVGEVLLLMRPRPSTGCPWLCGARSNPVVRPTSGRPNVLKVRSKGCSRSYPPSAPALALVGRQQPSAHHDIGETRGCQSSSRMTRCEIARIRSQFRFRWNSGARRPSFTFRPRIVHGDLSPLSVLCRRDATAVRPGPARLHTMSAISTDEVARVAALARVALSDEEVTRLAGELDAVASSFARVTSVVSPDLPATSHPVPLTNVLREDVPAPTLDVDELLAGAPASEDSMFLVPQILGEDSAS